MNLGTSDRVACLINDRPLNHDAGRKCEDKGALEQLNDEFLLELMPRRRRKSKAAACGVRSSLCLHGSCPNHDASLPLGQFSISERRATRQLRRRMDFSLSKTEALCNASMLAENFRLKRFGSNSCHLK